MVARVGEANIHWLRRGARATKAGENAVNVEYVVMGIISLLVLGYLLVALLRPELF